MRPAVEINNNGLNIGTNKGANVRALFNGIVVAVNIIGEHHEDKPFSSIESYICWISDAASGSRPGARYELHEGYVKRINRCY